MMWGSLFCVFTESLRPPWLVEFAGRWVIGQILMFLEFRFTASLILMFRTKVLSVG